MFRALLGLLSTVAAGCSSEPEVTISPSPELSALAEQSRSHLEALTLGHSLWIDHIDEWDVDQDTGRIRFVCDNDMTAEADVQIIGTYNTADSTWLWSWDNPSIEAPLREHALTLRRYGETEGLPMLTERKWAGTEDDAWDMTAVAAKLNDAQGAYRCPAGPTYVFVTFGEVRLSSTGNPGVE